MTKQGEIFEGSQLGLDLGDSAAAVPISPHAVRLQLNALIEQLKSAQDRLPWDEETKRQYQLSFPQLAKCLPPEEANFLSRQFEFEIARVGKRSAA